MADWLNFESESRGVEGPLLAPSKLTQVLQFPQGPPLLAGAAGAGMAASGVNVGKAVVYAVPGGQPGRTVQQVSAGL